MHCALGLGPYMQNLTDHGLRAGFPKYGPLLSSWSTLRLPSCPVLRQEACLVPLLLGHVAAPSHLGTFCAAAPPKATSPHRAGKGSSGSVCDFLRSLVFLSRGSGFPVPELPPTSCTTSAPWPGMGESPCFWVAPSPWRFPEAQMPALRGRVKVTGEMSESHSGDK